MQGGAATSMLSVGDIPDVFQDLTPIPQNDGPDRVCVIQYPSALTLAYNYMRAVWAAEELSGTLSLYSMCCMHSTFVVERDIFDCSLL